MSPQQTGKTFSHESMMNLELCDLVFRPKKTKISKSGFDLKYECKECIFGPITAIRSSKAPIVSSTDGENFLSAPRTRNRKITLETSIHSAFILLVRRSLLLLEKFRCANHHFCGFRRKNLGWIFKRKISQTSKTLRTTRNQDRSLENTSGN